MYVGMMYSTPSVKGKTLMETLLLKKIESAQHPNQLLRNDSFDSIGTISSWGSTRYGDDVCRCDDCLLGIVDPWMFASEEISNGKRKVKIN